MVIILDEKQMLPPPPPYAQNDGPISPPPFPGQVSRQLATLSTLPPHIMLYIVHQTLPQTERPYGDGKVERQRKVLYWMTISLRLVSRSLYIACMHVLRSTYLPAYMSLIRQPYSSDPFPMSAPSPLTQKHLAAPVNSAQRETQVLDYFLSVKVREDVWADDTELHLERGESFKDLFDLMQPRSRLEDLVREYGLQAGVISVADRTGNAVVSSICVASSSSQPGTPNSVAFASGHSPSSPSFPHARAQASQASTSAPRAKAPRKLAFSALSCSFSPRSVGLVFTSRNSKRTLVEVSRNREEKLEVTAKRLVKELVKWVEDTYR